MKRLVKIFLQLCFATPIVAFSAPKTQTLPRVTFAVAVYNPFIIEEDDGRLRGIYLDFLTDVIQRSGFDPEFESMPLTRVLLHASKGTHDFFMGISGMPETDAKYTEVARFHKLKVILIGLIKKIDLDKDTLVVGKAPNSYCPLFTKEQEKHIRYFEYRDIDQAMKMLTAKRISVLCTTRELFYFDLKRSQYINLKFNEFKEFQHDFTISLFANKKLPAEKIKFLGKTLDEVAHKKLLLTLYKKYGLGDLAKPQ